MPWGHIEAFPLLMRDAYETLECGLGFVLNFVAVDFQWSLTPLLQDMSFGPLLQAYNANNF